jgi:hypothetical protein
MALTVSQGFDTFLTRLAPLTSEHDKAKSHKDSVKGCMENNFKCYDFFETGSFGGGTGIRHHSDTDYFAVCPNDEVWTDSGYTLRKVRDALQNTFPRTPEIGVNTPAVKIPFGQYASETLELTPATFNGLVETPVGSKPSYNIPDFNDGWMKSSPLAHNAYVKREHDRLNSKVKPLIQLIKAWKYYQNVPISSFYLELRVTKYAEGETSIIYDIDVYRVFSHLENIALANLQDPMGISGYVKACKTDAQKETATSKLATAASRSKKAYENREKPDDAFYWWNLLYNDLFPAR